MSKKLSEDSAIETEGGADVPFFVHLLSGQSDPAAPMLEGSPPAPTYHCLDSPCTKKYPSDDDEATTWFGDKDY